MIVYIAMRETVTYGSEMLGVCATQRLAKRLIDNQVKLDIKNGVDFSKFESPEYEIMQYKVIE